MDMELDHQVNIKTENQTVETAGLSPTLRAAIEELVDEKVNKRVAQFISDFKSEINSRFT